jgi:hypothetical protein
MGGECQVLKENEKSKKREQQYLFDEIKPANQKQNVNK